MTAMLSPVLPELLALSEAKESVDSQLTGLCTNLPGLGNKLHDTGRAVCLSPLLSGDVTLAKALLY
jgi:hypothetical protein